MIGTPLRTGSPRRPEVVEPGPLGEERGLEARRRVEDVEADLVLGNVNGSIEVDARSLSRQRFGCRACPLLARDAPCGIAAGEIGFDEVARHAVEVYGPALTLETSERLKFVHEAQARRENGRVALRGPPALPRGQPR